MPDIVHLEKGNLASSIGNIDPSTLAKSLLLTYDEADIQLLRDDVVSARWKIRPYEDVLYFNFVESLVEQWTSKGRNPDLIWELEFNLRIFRSGLRSAAAWLLSNFSTVDFNGWKAFVLVRSLGEASMFKEARDVLDVIKFSEINYDIRHLLMLLRMHQGDFIFVNDVLKRHYSKSTAGMLRSGLQAAKISGDFQLALILLEAARNGISDGEYIHLLCQLSTYQSMSNNIDCSSVDRSQFGVYIISLNLNSSRMTRVKENLTRLHLFYSVIEGLNGRLLPLSFSRRLVGNFNADPAKLIGAFASHYAVWVRIVGSECVSALVLEDDALLHINPSEFVHEALRSGYGFVFCGERMEVVMERSRESFSFVPVNEAIKKRARPGNTIGADIYWLTKDFARKLIDLADETGPSEHVDGWLVNVAAKKFETEFASVGPSLGAEYGGFS